MGRSILIFYSMLFCGCFLSTTTSDLEIQETLPSPDFNGFDLESPPSDILGPPPQSVIPPENPLRQIPNQPTKQFSNQKYLR